MSLRPLGASEAAALARELGCDAGAWPPGVDFGGEGALLRVCHAEPGEGYHREHVRALTGAGAPSPELMTAVVASSNSSMSSRGLSTPWAAPDLRTPFR